MLTSNKKSLLKPYKSTGHVQWDIYNIVRDQFCQYRDIVVKTAVLTHLELIKNMQFDMYVKIVGERAADKGGKIIIAILGRNENGVNEIATTTEKFRLFINSVKEQDAEIILISPCKFQTHVLSFINDQKLARRISRYSYDHMKVVVPLGPGCSEHYIMSTSEARAQIEIHRIEQKEMKKIYTYDPQIVWLGAQPGDVIWIDRINPLTGRSADIRRVIKGEAP